MATQYIDPTSPQYEELRDRAGVYVFQFLHEEDEHFEVDYPMILALMEDGRQDLPPFKLVAHQLFNNSGSPIMDCSAVFEFFFRPVLAMRLLSEAFPLHVDIHTVIIPENVLSEIRKSIVSAGLSAHEGFILFLICKIQQTYVMDVSYHDNPREKQRIEKYPKEVQKLTRVLEHTDIRFNDRPGDKPRPELEVVSFKFNTDDTVKILDRHLLLDITKSIREHYSQGNLTDWRKQLKNQTAVWHDNQMPNVFRHKICKALHNLFKSLGLFNFEDKETTDKEIYAIGEVLRFSLVPFRDKKGKVLDYDADRDKITKQIRTAITRQELKYPETYWTKDRLNINFTTLNKYFDPDFIACGGEAYKVFDIRTVATITHRYDLNPLLGDLVHLFSCLDVRKFQIGHQFSALISSGIKNNTDYTSWEKLFEVLKEKTGFSKLSIEVEGSSERLDFQEGLSLDLLQRALKNFRRDYDFEFEYDFYESRVRPVGDSGGFGLDITGKLHLPENRFLPKFCRQCFIYLKNADPNYKDGITDYRYYEVIGQLLLKAKYFREHYHSDHFVSRQAEDWVKVSTPED